MFSGNNINQIEFYLIEKCLYYIYYLVYCLIKKIIIFMIKSYKINFSNKLFESFLKIQLSVRNSIKYE